jgi:hypothetical protein
MGESETELRFRVKGLLFDDAYFSNVIGDKKAWFTRKDVLDLIYDQFFHTANSLGRHPTTPQYFQPLAPQTLVLADSAIQCELCKYANAMKATVI